MAGKISTGRSRGHIRRRGGSFQVSDYAGLDPLTGGEIRLTGSASTESEAKAILRRLRAQVDEQRAPKTKASFRAAMDSWLRVLDVEESTRESYEQYARNHLYPAFGDESISRVSTQLLEAFYAELRRCSQRCDGRRRVEHRVDGPHECRTVRHRRPPGRPPAGGYPPHDCAVVGCVVVECRPHECRPLSPATIRRIHFAIRGVLTAAERWGWITSNPATIARKPRQPAPQPEPPTVAQAAQIIEAAWGQDESWGTLVWLVIVTGMRRAELLALRWSDVDLAAGVVTIRRNYVRARGKSVEKDTKTHPDAPAGARHGVGRSVHRAPRRYQAMCRNVGADADPKAFLFSYRPEFDRPCSPSGVTHRYAKMCADLGIDSHLHALRHYPATELLTAGVDLRTGRWPAWPWRGRRDNVARVCGVGR